MINAENLVYSKAAASRILGLFYRQVKEVRVYKNSIWVYLPGKRPFFMSKSLFHKHFKEHRIAQARALTVTPNLFHEGLFTVRNESKNSRYEVSAKRSVFWCECEDYRNQEMFLDDIPRCKHVYAVMQHLGSADLETAILSETAMPNAS